MPWKVCTPMSQRLEFILQAKQGGLSFSELCRRHKISRTTGYKWLRRHGTLGDPGLADRSRKPLNSPEITDPDISRAILELRTKHPAWGARKLRAVLEREHPEQTWPAPSTVHAVLKRSGCIDPDEGARHKAFISFERPQPNELWQMDFKGDIPTRNGRCHPFTCLDDHSRFNLILQACKNQQESTVSAALSAAFRRYGLPDAILADNGGPWGGCGYHTYTRLSLWLMRLDVRLIHGRPFHPQTQGKDERFHRTLLLELLSRNIWRDLDHCQSEFDPWRDVYNFVRPHQSLDMKTPGLVYRPSTRSFPESLPPIVYPDHDVVRNGRNAGRLRFQGRNYKIPLSFAGLPLALRPTTTDGLWHVYFCRFHVLTLNQRSSDQPVKIIGNPSRSS